MLKTTRHILVTLSILILSGIVLHGAIPHHHHHYKETSSVCCGTHNSDNDTHEDHHKTEPCNLLNSIYAEKYAPQIQAHTKYLPTNHFQNIAILTWQTFEPKVKIAEYHILLPKEELYGFIITHSLPHRAPPTVS